MQKNDVLNSNLKRMLIYWQLYKVNLIEIKESETIKELVQIAKQNKNKSFVDIRQLAVEQIRAMNAFLFKLKGTMSSTTWNLLMQELSSEKLKEMNLLLDEVVEFNEQDLEDITKQIKNWKQNARMQNNSSKDQNSNNEG